MEIKKSEKADLEGKRLQRFMLGLVLALAALFVALEYSFEPDDVLDDPELLERLSSDEELPPLMRAEKELVLVPKTEPKPTVKLKVVEDEEVIPEEMEQPTEQPVESDITDDTAEPAEPEETSEGDDVVSFRVVEDLPLPPGGYLEFMKWLTRNLKYPPEAQQRKQQGKVLAEFIVNKDGSITDVKVVRSLCTECDDEALRVLRMMPRWTPGIQFNKPCRTKVCIPIVFRL